MSSSAPAGPASLAPGLEGKASLLVTDKHTAKTMKSGSLDVLATPQMVALVEEAACSAIAAHLAPGTTSVGTHLDVKHLAPTPIGMSVTATAKLTKVEKRALTFDIAASDGKEQIASGTHSRFIIDVEKFMKKAVDKSAL